jgi:hypothetical protein
VTYLDSERSAFGQSPKLGAGLWQQGGDFFIAGSRLGQVLGALAFAALLLTTGCGSRSAAVPKPTAERSVSTCNYYMSHGRNVEATRKVQMASCNPAG